MENERGNNYWGTLINPDKSPAPLLEQLCVGLAQLMVKLDSGSGSSDLTPDKLARFYRQVGANYDTLFLHTKGPALSFIYQSLGCFHTLQPTTNPFEPPSIPALLPTGFVRWQVINLLLCPDEHAQYLQAALGRWDVPNPSTGGTFPKVIPRDAFPEAPDKDMVQWHEIVSQRLEKEHSSSSSSRRHFPAEFVRYYPAAKYPNYPEGGQHFFQRENNNNNHRSHEASSTPMPRAFFDDQPDDARRYRRYRSSDGRPRRRRMFANGSDGRADSRASSRNPSPRQTVSPASTARAPMRSKTTRVRNRESPERKSFYHRHHHHQPMHSSDSSNNDDGLFPQRRYGSTGDQQDGRPSHLSQGRGRRLPRRHSHDATASTYTKGGGRNEEEPDVVYSYKPVRNSHRDRRYGDPGVKFHVRYDESPPDHHGSSVSDRPRSSSNGSSETAWKGWKGSSRTTGRRVSAHE
ncbi:hypothetical protein UA08_01205 [Talaromyces atroroseus]|uniref:DUF7514 domain-containing protein n=1 Tax=Talaromyces atroroseus TaxID=1441469 RepID=A0A1Q5QC49_TALAT|nr:hypothetical protein UA08_01205 [Talaromyces atroroseus]OKL63532.1 hypothetical protein UA08_01205 [Talaromyces atroroseus]